MSGASITIEINDRHVREVLDQLVDLTARNMKPALRAIGEYLDLAHRQRWDREVSPDGAPWAPLDPKHRARKKRNPDKVLVLDTHLRDTLRYQVGDDSLSFGTDRIYGATHQFGAPERGIPARPFLGLSEDDRREVLEILQEHLAGGIER